MDLLWVQMAKGSAAIFVILGAMVTLPPAFVGAISEWLRKPRFELKMSPPTAGTVRLRHGLPGGLNESIKANRRRNCWLRAGLHWIKSRSSMNLSGFMR
jgi:hypothetical protein